MKTLNFASLALLFSTALLFLASLGCGHFHKVSSTESEDESKGVHFNIGSKEVKVGDKLNIFEDSCHNVHRPRHAKSCFPQKVGEATVLKIIDENNSVILPDQKSKIGPESKVEKQ